MHTYNMPMKTSMEYKLDRYKGALMNYMSAKEAYDYSRQHLENTKTVLLSELTEVRKENKTCVVHGVEIGYEKFSIFNKDSIKMLRKKYNDVYESVCNDAVKIKMEAK